MDFDNHFQWFDPRISFSPPGQTLKIEGLCTVRELLRQNVWVAKIDLKDAYLTVPISTAFLHFLRFIWKGRIFQYPIWPPTGSHETKSHGATRPVLLPGGAASGKEWSGQLRTSSGSRSDERC